MGFPRASITSYQELVRNFVHQFTDISHRKMSTTGDLALVHQGGENLHTPEHQLRTDLA